MLPWFDANPDRGWWLLFSTFLCAVGLIGRAFTRPDPGKSTGFDWAWALAGLGILVAARWPTWFFPLEFNQDESGFIAGAMTLRHDPMFWRSVDGDTSGPFNFYALLPLGSLLGDSYLSARVTALALVLAAILFAHHAMMILGGQRLARLGSFPAFCFEACAWDRSFLHYSSELVAMALFAGALFLAVRRFGTVAGWRTNLAGGIMLGAMPLAKLQMAPLGLALGLMWLAGDIATVQSRGSRSGVPVAALVAGAVLPAAFWSVALTVTGQWDYALLSYVGRAGGYIAGGSLNGQLLIDFWLLDRVGHAMLGEWIIGGLLVLAVLVRLAWTVTGHFRLKGIALSSSLLLIVSLFCVVVPGRPFLHYWQIFVIPWTFGMGTVFILAAKNPGLSRSGLTALAMAFLCLAAGPMVLIRSTLPVRFLGPAARQLAQTPPPIAQVAHRYARPGEALALWGWMNSYYVATGLRQATRTAHAEALLNDRGHREHYQGQYLADLRRTEPPLFIDAVAPGSFMFSEPQHRHEQVFPALGAYIREFYALAANVQGNRIFVRRDRYAATPEPLTSCTP